MKNFFSYTVLFPVLSLLVLAKAGQAQFLPAEDAAFLDSLLLDNYRPDQPGGVLLVAKDGVPVYRKGFGMASMELGVANSADNVFNIGSNSKQFTAVAVLQLVEAGKLSLDDDIRKYLPGFPDKGVKITVRQVLSHTSGIGSYTEMPDWIKLADRPVSPDSLMRYFQKEELLYEPGTDWSYSNSGFVVAAQVVEKVSGLPFNQYLEEKIFQPLGMINTGFLSWNKLIPRLASPYEGSPETGYIPAPHFHSSWAYAAGQMVSTVDDLLKWDNALRSGKVLKASTLKEAWKDTKLTDGRSTYYGLGWASSDVKGTQVLLHGGSWPGYLSNLIRVPSQGLFLVLLTNNGGVDMYDVSTSAILELAGLSEPMAPAIQLDSVTLSAYAGVYPVYRQGSRLVKNMGEEPIYRYITVVKDTLFTQTSGGERTKLDAIGDDVFRMKQPTNFIRFFRGKNGQVSGAETYRLPFSFGPRDNVTKTDLPLPSSRAAIAVDAAILARYAGVYSIGGGINITIRTDGSRLFVLDPSGEEDEMFAETPTLFFSKESDMTMRFILKEDKVTSAEVIAGQKMMIEKIE